MGICCMAQETQTGALDQPRGVRWGGRWEGASRGRGYRYTYGCTSAGSWKKQESSRKTPISALLTMPKPLTMWITITCEKF